MKSLLACLAATTTLSTPLFWAEKPEPKKPTGCEVGAEMPAFYVREVNGTRPNLAVCLVCQNGARPVVMIAVRTIDKQVERLLEAVDRMVDSRRAEGLRAFAIFLAPEAKELKELQPRLVTLARDRNLSLPLTIPVESATGPASLALPDDVQTTVLFYVEKRIVSRYFFSADELTDRKIEQLTKDAKLMLPNGAAPPGKPTDTEK